MSDVCKHNTSLQSECFDCNEQELYDSVMKDVLDEIIGMLFDKHFVLSDMIETAMAGVSEDEELKERIVTDINDRLVFDRKKWNTVGEMEADVKLSLEKTHPRLDTYEINLNPPKDASIFTGTYWCVEDVRNLFGEKISHMTDDEISEQLYGMTNRMVDGMTEYGWVHIECNFEIPKKEK